MGFDPDGTQYMPYRHLSEFLDVLEAPLQIAKPNKFKIIHMDIPICRWTNPESGEIKVATFADRPGYQRISSSLWKQREDYCAEVIQEAWHHHKLRNTEDHTDVDPQTGEDDDDDEDLDEDEAAVEAAAKDETKAPSLVTKTVKLPPINPESKHLIEVRSASEED